MTHSGLHQQYEFEIRRGTVDVRKRKLLLTPEYIEFESRHLHKNVPVKILKTDMLHVRIGMKAMKNLDFPVGREFRFEFKKSASKIFRIRFKSAFHTKRKDSLALFNELNDIVWKLYLDDLLLHYEVDFIAGKKIHIAKTELDINGISFKKKTSINRQKLFVEWDDIVVHDLHENFYVASRKNKAIRRIFSLADDWDAVLLFAFLKKHLK